jgi:hypothetical protein
MQRALGRWGTRLSPAPAGAFARQTGQNFSRSTGKFHGRQICFSSPPRFARWALRTAQQAELERLGNIVHFTRILRSMPAKRTKPNPPQNTQPSPALAPPLGVRRAGREFPDRLTRFAPMNLVGTRSTASHSLVAKSQTRWNASLPSWMGGSWAGEPSNSYLVLLRNGMR